MDENKSELQIAQLAECCRNCKFYDINKIDFKSGFCRRYPPQATIFMMQDRAGQPSINPCATFPPVFGDQLCGEYKSKMNA
jgi:hypothetical protein